MSEPSLPIGLIIAICGVLIVAFSGLAGVLLYVIRAEVRKGNKTTDDVHAQLVPDHSLSLRDAVDRIEKRQVEDRETTADRLDGMHTAIVDIRKDHAEHVKFHLNERKA